MTADEIIWVTQAGGRAWLQDTGLALDADGFVQVNDHLQTLTDPDVFAAGDIAAMHEPPAGESRRVRGAHGPPLADNLRRAVQRRAAAAPTARNAAGWR